MKKKKLLSMLMMFVILSSTVFSGLVFADETESESAVVEEETKPATERGYRQLYIAGDSTVFDWETGKDAYNTGTYNPKAGWLQGLPMFVTDNQALRVHHNAADDYSVKTYLYGFPSRQTTPENKLDSLLNKAGGAQPGDYLLVQFGQDDGLKPDDSMSAEDKAHAQDNYVTLEEYRTYLIKFLDEATERQLKVILVTPIADWKTDESGKFISTYADYAQVVRDLAAEYDTFLIDMEKKSLDFYSTLTEEELKKVFLFCEPGEYNTEMKDGAADKENFQTYGAVQMARLIVEGLKETGEECFVKNLSSAALPTAKPNTPSIQIKQNKEKVFTIQWGVDSKAQVYFVYHKVDGEWKVVKQTELTSYTTTEKLDTDNNEYKVVAVNNVGASADSEIVERSASGKKKNEETTTAAVTEEKSDNGLLIIIIVVVAVVIVVGVVVFIVIKKRQGYDEYEDDEYEEEDDDEYEDDEYEDDEYEDDEYEDDEYEDDEYEDDEE